MATRSPMHRASWRARWEELTAELEVELAHEEVDVQRVAAALVERQRLLMLPPLEHAEEGLATDEELKRWLVAAKSVERRVFSEAEERQAALRRALEVLASNAPVRGRFQTGDDLPAASRLFSQEL